MWKTAPDPVDVQDLQFKLCAKIDIFNNKDNGRFSKYCNLVASASRFDLIIVGTISNTIQVIRVKSLQEHIKNDGDKTDYPRREISIPSPVRHISVNCEETILAVIIERDNTPWAIFYDIKSFLQQSINKLEEIRLSPTPGVEILDINWNPTLSTIFTACKSDGSLGVYELKQPGVNINELPVASGTTCFCWSPKGKQIAVGSKDGKITQYKPDLKAVKVINAPPFKTAHTLIGLQWISNFQFIGIYQPQNTDDPVNLIVIEAPKTGESSFINFDDICYSNGNTRPTQFYTILQRNWNLLMVASSNSMEVGVLNCTNDIWTQWIMGDASRAELPLNDNHEESLPIGLSLNTSSTEDIPWGESNLPPSPILLLLSHFGTLCCFNVIYLKTDIPTICSPPDPIVQTINPNLFTTKSITMNNENVTTPQVSQQPAEAPKISSFTNLVNQLKPQEVQKTQALSFGVSQTSPMVNKVNNLTVSTVTAPITPISTTSVSTPKAEISQLNESTIHEKNQSEIDAEAEKLFAQMVREECLFLESEIKQLLTRCKSLKIYVGSENDKTNIVQLTTIIDEFLKEIVDITTGQNAEVHSLKQNLLQSFAWYEEAKSRFNASQDKTIAILQRAQPLDSASAKQLADIRYSNYYLESQLIQANRALDEQWENFQDYCRKTYKIKIPTMEAIFQTMVNQMAVIQKQNYILKDISNRIKYRSRQPLGASLLINVDDPKELENELKRLTLEPKSILDIQTEIVKNRTKFFTETKADNLRNYLKNRKFPNVTLIKPQISNITIQQSSASKLKQLSLLGAKLSPVSKDVARKLDFVQSTPKQDTSKIITTTTPIEGLEKFTQNFEQNNFKTSETTSFTTTPLSFPIKTTLSSGPNSAFVSTSTTSSASVTNALTTKPVMIVSSVAKTTPTFCVNLTNQPTISNIDTSRPFSFTFTTKTTTVGATTSTTITTTTTTPRTLIFTFTTQPTTMTTTAGKTFTFNFGDKNAPTSNSIFKPTTTPTSVFNIGTTKAPVFGNKSLFTSLAPTVTTTVVSTITTTKPAQSLFSNTSSLLPQTTISVKPTESVSILTTTPTSIPIQTQSITTTTTTSATSLFGNVSFSPKTTTTTATTITGAKIATIGQSTIFATTPKTTITTTVVTTTKPSFTITPIIPTSSQQIVATTGAPTTTTSAPQATLIFATKPSTTNVTTTTVTVTSAASPAFASVAPTIKTAVSTPVAATTTTTSNITTATSSVFSSVSTTAQPLNLVTATKPSSFTPVTTQTSIFSTATTAPVTQTSIFADKQKSLFGTSTTLTTTTTTTSIFGTSTVSKPSIFSSTPVFGSTAPTTTTTSIFGAAVATTTTTTTTTTSNASIFASTTPATTSSIFGTVTTSTTSASSIFGSSTTAATTTTTSIFASATPATTSTSIFGTAAPPTTTTTIFGGFAQTATAAKPAFGATAPTTTSSIFGTTVSTSSPSIFGSTATSTTKFGTTTFGTVPASTTASPFNQQSSVFGQASSVFGSNASFGGTPSSFGAVAAATTNSFSFGQSSGSVFGNAPTTNTGSIFRNTPTTSSGFGAAPVFGNAPTSTLSPFGATAPTVSTPSSFSFSNAAANNTTSTGFGFGSLSVGTTPTTSTFGTTPANPFGTAASSTFGTTPVSSSSGSIFGSSSVFGTNTSTSTFGGSSPAFGSPSTFGQQSTFGQSSFGGNASSSGSFFGSSANTTTGPFSGGNAGVGQTGFGTATGSSFQSSSGFGSPPVFGSPAPAFGGSPSFGGAPTFGSTATFGSPTRVFGGANSSFGTSSTAQSPSFGNLANQPTVGFGNLAQQASGQSNSAPFSGNSSFSSWR